MASATAETDPYKPGPYDSYYAGEKSEAGGAPLIDLERIRAFVWRQKRVFIVVAVAALLLGLIITLLMVPRYRANATLRIEANSISVFDEGGVEPGIDWRYLDRYSATLARVLASRSMAERVANNLDLANDKSFFEAMDIEMPAGEGERGQTARRNLAIGILSGNVAMETNRDDNIANVTFESQNPAMAAKIANAYAKAFVEANVMRQSEANAYAKKLVQEQIAQTRQDLTEAERAALAYTRQNRIIKTDETPSTGTAIGDPAGSSLTASNLLATNSEYIEARNRRILAEQRWKSSQKGNALELPEARDNPTIQSLLADQAKLRGELAELRGRYLPDHPEITEREEQLKAISAEISDAAQDVRASLRREYEVSLAQENQLQSARQNLTNETLDEQSRRVQLSLLSRNTEALRYRLTKLLDRLGEVESASDVSPTNIQILDEARVPSSPFSPNFLLNLAVSLVVGLGVAAGVAVLRELLDDSIYSPESAESRLGMPILGVAPYTSESADFDDSHSALGEAYSSLRVAVDAATGGSIHKTLLITSSKPSEGKSTTARMLAQDYARAGRRVLLVDADLRNPSLHKAVGGSNAKGLSNMLANDEPVFDNLLPRSVMGLDILPSGPTPTNPAHVLSSQAIALFLDRMAIEYQVVIIDSPPVMGLADAPMLARHAEYTVMVIEAGRAQYSGVRKALRRLGLAGAHIPGLIMTKFDQKQAGYGYGYGYEYYSYGTKAARS